MSLEIAYAAMGGDLETVRGRLLTDERIEKFAKIFLQDTSMQTLESALEAGDLPEAYRGAHTLKGRPTWKRFLSSCRPCATPMPWWSTPSPSSSEIRRLAPTGRHGGHDARAFTRNQKDRGSDQGV